MGRLHCQDPANCRSRILIGWVRFGCTCPSILQFPCIGPVSSEAAMKSRTVLCSLALCLLLTGGAFAKKKLASKSDIDLSQFDFRSGDILFQHLPGKLGSVICDVTNSPLSHC